MQFLALSALVASTLSVAHAAGVAAVHNKCGSSMYLWSVGDSSSKQVHLPDGSVVYNETYRSRSDGAGISIKICGEPELNNNATQMEYTIDPPGTASRKIWYDISNINGNALSGVDYELKPSDKSCPTVYCAAGEVICKAVYNVWNDDASTHACSADANLVLTLCPDKKDGTDATTDGIDAGTATGPASVTSSGDGNPLGEYAAPAAKIASKLAGGASSAITYLNPVFEKRDETAAHVARHAHQHSHERMRRSRVFRANEA